MNESNPTRRRWRRKRWIMAGLLALVIGSPLGTGPVENMALRGWLPMESMVVGDAATFASLLTPLASPYGRYRMWWWSLGELPDYEFVVRGKSISYMPTDRYYHSHPTPQITWWLRDGF